MAHNYERRIQRILNPHDFDNNASNQKLAEKEVELLNSWHNQLQLDGKSKATQADYLEKAAMLLRKVDEEPDDIGKDELNDYLAGKSQGTIDTYKATLKQFFVWYYRSHLRVPEDEEPRFLEQQLTVSGGGKDKVKEEDVPAKEEVEALLESAYNHRDRALIALLADKGMRISEALALDLSDVHYDEAGIYLMVPEAKKDYESYRRNRLTWSRPALKDWLESHPLQGEEDAPLFCSLHKKEGEHIRMTYSAARGRLEAMKDRGEVSDNITLHKFRHYSATRDRQKKHLRDSYIVKDKGWDDPSMLERYDHLTDDTVDKAQIRQMVEDGQLDKSVLEDMSDSGNGEEQKLELIKCPNCGETNSPERDYCDRCNQPFTDEGISKQEQLRNAIQEYVEEKGLMDKLAEETG